IVALGLLGLVVDEARGLEVGAHALRAGEPGGVDAGLVHHPHMLVEIVEELVDGIARRALRVVVQDQPVARLLLDQLAWREMVLEVNDHRVTGPLAVSLPAAPAGRTVKRSGNRRVNCRQRGCVAALCPRHASSKAHYFGSTSWCTVFEVPPSGGGLNTCTETAR